MTTAIEKSWASVPPQLFTADGTAFGVVTVANSTGFKVKQQVVISATGLPDLTVKIMRFISPTQFYVGPTNPGAGQGLTQRTNIALYTVAAGAFIYAQEQPKVTIKPEDIIQAVYRQEPGTTIGVELDDQWGNPYNAGNPIPVSPSTGITPTVFGDVKVTFDANSNPIRYSFYKSAILQGYITVTYDVNGNAIDYQGYSATGNPQ